MNLSIIRLDHSVAEIKTSSPGIDIETLSKGVFDFLSCKPALDDLVTPKWNVFARRNTSCDSSLNEKLIKSIMRYIKESDRWTALSSILLKSIAFHRHIDPNMTIDVIAEQKLPIVDLPRTKFNRPYLPLPLVEREQKSAHDANEEVKESRESMINVSHQYPYICLVQKRGSEHMLQTQIGCDLVVFELRLNKFMPTITDFLQSFVGCFTSTEWQSISNDASSIPRSDDILLKEFYLRWAMKEAYTKALGLGMNIDFDSFETRLIGYDTDGAGCWIPHGGIWDSIATDMQNNSCNNQIKLQFSCVGQVVRTRESKPEEYWVFTFIPLVDKVAETSKQSSKRVSESRGCICVCEGPYNDEAVAVTASNSKDRIVMEHLTLVELIQLHGMKISDIIHRVDTA